MFLPLTVFPMQYHPSPGITGRAGPMITTQHRQYDGIPLFINSQVIQIYQETVFRVVTDQSVTLIIRDRYCDRISRNVRPVKTGVQGLHKICIRALVHIPARMKVENGHDPAGIIMRELIMATHPGQFAFGTGFSIQICIPKI
jgi:hypothetical protein